MPTVMQKVGRRAKRKCVWGGVLWRASVAFLVFVSHVFISKVIKLLGLPCITITNTEFLPSEIVVINFTGVSNFNS